MYLCTCVQMNVYGMSLVVYTHHKFDTANVYFVQFCTLRHLSTAHTRQLHWWTHYLRQYLKFKWIVYIRVDCNGFMSECSWSCYSEKFTKKILAVHAISYAWFMLIFEIYIEYMLKHTKGISRLHEAKERPEMKMENWSKRIVYISKSFDWH